MSKYLRIYINQVTFCSFCKWLWQGIVSQHYHAKCPKFGKIVAVVKISIGWDANMPIIIGTTKKENKPEMHHILYVFNYSTKQTHFWVGLYCTIGIPVLLWWHFIWYLSDRLNLNCKWLGMDAFGKQLIEFWFIK